MTTTNDHSEYDSSNDIEDPLAVGLIWSPTAASDPFRYLQWHLDGYLTPGANAFGANIDKISTEYKGAGVRVGVIDEGFDLANPDLAGRFDLNASFDPRDSGASNIAPDSSAHVHGTWVSGVIGAADNDFGTVGVAAGATLVGFYARFGAGGSLRAELADLLQRQAAVDISNNSWGYTTQFSDNFTDPAWASIKNAIQFGVETGRDGLGTIYVFAAGNDRQYIANNLSYDGDNTNYHSLTNSRRTITAAATNSNGEFTAFSTPGASILVAAPGEGIVTSKVTDHDGNPNNDWAAVSGTSFSAPIVSGVLALMLEANPGLGYRDAQEILALSARKTALSTSDWAANGASNWNGGGNLVSHDFGFGLVDAHAAVRLAQTWTGVHTAANEAVISVAGNLGGNTALVDNVTNDYVVSLAQPSTDFSIDWIEVDLSLLHTHIGDLKVELIAPTGTRSVLMDRPSAGNNTRDNLTFTFSTTHDWGESPAGNWHLRVTDAGTGGTGSVSSFALRFYGDYEGQDDTYFYTDDFSLVSASNLTLTDAAGVDTINAAAVTTGMTIRLAAGQQSQIAGRTMTISAGTMIENVFGGDGADLIYGNDANNRLQSGQGHDSLWGGLGNDILIGGSGNDMLDGGAGNDLFVVDSLGDVVVELANGGADIVISFVGGYAMPTNVEYLYVVGTSAAGLPDWVVAAISNIVVMPPISVPPVVPPANNPAPSNPGNQTDTVAALPPCPTDFNGDRHSDILWQHKNGAITEWLMDGQNFCQSGLIGGGGDANWRVVGAEGDFNGDGKADLLWQHANGAVTLWFMDGMEFSQSGLIGGDGDPDWQIKGTGDFNGDGKADIVWQDTSGAVALWLGNGSDFTQTSIIGSCGAGGWEIEATGDINGDGRDDLIWQRADNGAMAAWLMDGTSFQATSYLGGEGGDPNWDLRACGDFNGDGKDDILLQHASGAVVAWLMDGTQVTPSGFLGGNGDASWEVKGTGDFDHDGRADLIWQQQGTGAVFTWQMNGFDFTPSGQIGGGGDPNWQVIALG